MVPAGGRHLESPSSRLLTANIGQVGKKPIVNRRGRRLHGAGAVAKGHICGFEQRGHAANVAALDAPDLFVEDVRLFFSGIR